MDNNNANCQFWQLATGNKHLILPACSLTLVFKRSSYRNPHSSGLLLQHHAIYVDVVIVSCAHNFNFSNSAVCDHEFYSSLVKNAVDKQDLDFDNCVSSVRNSNK